MGQARDSRGANPAEDALAAALVDALDREEDVLVAYLFGSRARGGGRPGSDVDVAVLLAEGADLDRRHLDLIGRVASVAGSERADVVVLNRAPVALAYRVIRDGRLLACRDERARVRHWASVVDRYLDTAPMRRTLDAGLRHRLAEGRFGKAPG